MKTLIIHDESGYILQQATATTYRLPVGVPYLEIEVPPGKQVVSVDVSVTPHQAILEDVPPSEIDELKSKLQATQQAVDFLLMGGM